jgi:hypothetical protein
MLIARAAAYAALGLAASLPIAVTPGGFWPDEAAQVSDASAQASTPKPDLMLFTGLPIIWGEGGAFDPQSRPAASYRMLQAEFRVRPLDVLDDPGLAAGRLLLLAQPRALAPGELVALDAWVRRGGRVLILTDPQLVWPSELPLGDIRRPPAIGLLDPLLTHWGLRLERGEQGLVVRDLPDGSRLRLAAPGRFVATKPACATEDSLWARCRLGAGEALLLADADLMHDALWAGDGAGAGRSDRTADNPLVIADRLDRLAGIGRARIAPRIDRSRWGADRHLPWLLAGLPLILAAAVASTLIRLRRA